MSEGIEYIVPADVAVPFTLRDIRTTVWEVIPNAYPKIADLFPAAGTQLAYPLFYRATHHSLTFGDCTLLVEKDISEGGAGQSTFKVVTEDGKHFIGSSPTVPLAKLELSRHKYKFSSGPEVFGFLNELVQNLLTPQEQNIPDMQKPGLGSGVPRPRRRKAFRHAGALFAAYHADRSATGATVGQAGKPGDQGGSRGSAGKPGAARKKSAKRPRPPQVNDALHMLADLAAPSYAASAPKPKRRAPAGRIYEQAAVVKIEQELDIVQPKQESVIEDEPSPPNGNGKRLRHPSSRYADDAWASPMSVPRKKRTRCLPPPRSLPPATPTPPPYLGPSSDGGSAAATPDAEAVTATAGGSSGGGKPRGRDGRGARNTEAEAEQGAQDEAAQALLLMTTEAAAPRQAACKPRASAPANTAGPPPTSPPAHLPSPHTPAARIFPTLGPAEYVMSSQPATPTGWPLQFPPPLGFTGRIPLMPGAAVSSTAPPAIMFVPPPPPIPIRSMYYPPWSAMVLPGGGAGGGREAVRAAPRLQQGPSGAGGGQLPAGLSQYTGGLFGTTTAGRQTQAVNPLQMPGVVLQPRIGGGSQRAGPHASTPGGNGPSLVPSAARFDRERFLWQRGAWPPTDAAGSGNVAAATSGTRSVNPAGSSAARGSKAAAAAAASLPSMAAGTSAGAAEPAEYSGGNSNMAAATAASAVSAGEEAAVAGAAAHSAGSIMVPGGRGAAVSAAASAAAQQPGGGADAAKSGVALDPPARHLPDAAGSDKGDAPVADKGAPGPSRAAGKSTGGTSPASSPKAMAKLPAS